MKILIIGGTHFIGPYVVRSLHSQGHEVILFHRGETNYDFPFSLSTVKGDRADLLSFKDRLLELSPDIVIDMIPYTEEDANQIVALFNGRIKRLVIISSCDVYRAYDRLWQVSDRVMPVPLDENAALRENFYPYRKIMKCQPNEWGYHYDKILVENIIRSSTLDTTILRLPMVYGPSDYSRIYPYLKRMDDNRPILLNENKAGWRFARGYVEDIAHAIVLSALDKKQGSHIFNVSEMHAHTEIEWIKHIGKIAGWKQKVIKFPQEKLPSHLKEETLAWEQDLTLNTHHIRDILGYKERYTQDEAMHKSITWLRTNKPTKIDPDAFNYEAEDLSISKSLRFLRYFNSL